MACEAQRSSKVAPRSLSFVQNMAKNSAKIFRVEKNKTIIPLALVQHEVLLTNSPYTHLVEY